jgi:hypothetical protein
MDFVVVFIIQYNGQYAIISLGMQSGVRSTPLLRAYAGAPLATLHVIERFFYKLQYNSPPRIKHNTSNICETEQS